MKQLTAALLLFVISATAGFTRELSYSCSLPPLAFKFYKMGDGNLYDMEVIRGTAVDLFSAVEADLQGSGVCRHRVWSFDYDGPITVQELGCYGEIQPPEDAVGEVVFGDSFKQSLFCYSASNLED
jgi:hypothetical protein